MKMTRTILSSAFLPFAYEAFYCNLGEKKFESRFVLLQLSSSKIEEIIEWKVNILSFGKLQWKREDCQAGRSLQGKSVSVSLNFKIIVKLLYTEQVFDEVL